MHVNPPNGIWKVTHTPMTLVVALICVLGYAVAFAHSGNMLVGLWEWAARDGVLSQD